MKKYFLAIVLLSMLVVAMPASGSTYVCQGSISGLSLYSGGYVYFYVSGMNAATTICSLSANFGNWTPDMCKGVYAMALSASLSGKQIAVEFNDNLTCTSQPVGAGIANSSYSVYFPN